MGQLEKAKRAISHSIANMLEMQFPDLARVQPTVWDTEKAVEAIWMAIPDTNAEAEESLQELFAMMPERTTPSVMDKIRDAMGFDRGTPIGLVLEAVLDEVSTTALRKAGA